MNITIDFEGAIARALAPEALEPILDKHLKAAITSAIDDATGYRSEFQKALKVQLSEALPHGLGIDDVAKFQHILNGALQAVMGEANGATIQAAMKKVVANVMPDVPAVVKMSELLKKARDGFNKDRNEPFYAYFEPSKYDNGGWLYLDSNEKPGDTHYTSSHKLREDRKYSAAHRLAINAEGEVYALKMDGKDILPASRPDVIGRFEGLLMAMYVGRTRVEIDMDDDDVESASAEQYD